MSALPFRSLRARLTYANVMSTVAVVAMLSTGTAYAAGRIGSADVIDNSLRTVDVRDGTLTGADIGLDKVGSADVAGLQGGDVLDGSLRGDDIEDDSINSPDVFGLNGSDITNDSLGTDDVAALTGQDITDGSLDGTELGDGSVGSDEVANGSLGVDHLSGSAKTQLLPKAYYVNGVQNVDTTSTPGERVVVFSRELPAGTYVVQLAGEGFNASGLDIRGFSCNVALDDDMWDETNAGTIPGSVLGLNDGSATDNREAFAITGFGTLPTGGTVALKCSAPVGTVNIGGNLVAIRVSSVS